MREVSVDTAQFRTKRPLVRMTIDGHEIVGTADDLRAVRWDFLNARWVSVVDGPGFVVASSAPSREAAMLKAEQIVDQQIGTYGG